MVAVGWATVDLERAAAEIPEVHFGGPGDEQLLGARAMRATLGAVDLLLLEPSTEGRLAGWLARNGEGVVVLYVEGRGAAGGPGFISAFGRPGRLEIPDDRAQPFVVSLDPE